MMLQPRLRDLQLAPTDLAKVITKFFVREVIVHLVRQGGPLSEHLLLWSSRLVEPLVESKKLHLDNTFFQDAVADTVACLRCIMCLLSHGSLAPVEKVMASRSGTLVLLKNSILNSGHYKSLQKSFASNQAAEEQFRPEVVAIGAKLKSEGAETSVAVQEALGKLHTWRDMLRPGLSLAHVDY